MTGAMAVPSPPAQDSRARLEASAVAPPRHDGHACAAAPSWAASR